METAALATPCPCEQLRKELARAKEEAKEFSDAYDDATLACYGEGQGDGSEEVLSDGIDRWKRLGGQGIALRTVFGEAAWNLDADETVEFCKTLKSARDERESLRYELATAQAECARLREELTPIFSTGWALLGKSGEPSGAAWEALVKYAYEHGKDGSREIQQITEHYNWLRAARSLLDEARDRYRWRPISEIHEDYGDCVLVNIVEDPGNIKIGSNVCIDWDASEWTHFTRFAPIGQAEYERMKADVDAARKPEAGEHPA